MGELAKDVQRVSDKTGAGRRMCEVVADRLLDKVRVRVVTEKERALAALILGGEDLQEISDREDVQRWLSARADAVLAELAADQWESVRGLVHKIAVRFELMGLWDEYVYDDVPAEIRPLHMSRVLECLGALIPDKLHQTDDKAAAKAKDDFGVLRGCSKLHMDNWGVSVRAEDALARGRLQEDALEFFLLVLRRACRGLGLPVFVGSKTVGKEVGRQENATKLATVMEKWRKVWPGAEVRKAKHLLLMVAVDDKPAPQDWMCVSVRSVVDAQLHGESERLVVGIHDIPATKCCTACGSKH